MPCYERVLVTGAAGFIGSHFVDRLLSLGARVTGVDNFDPLYAASEKRNNLAAAFENPGFRLVEVDCADPSALDAVPQEPFDAIVHLAAKAGVRPSILDPLGYMRANVVGTQSVLEFARQRGVRRVVFASSSSVYGNGTTLPFSEDQTADRPVSPYAASKRAAELLCATYHDLYRIGILVLRCFTVYGPRQRPDLAIRKLGSLMLRGAPLPFYGDGSTARDYTWIDDILDGMVAALRRTREVPEEFEIINLGGSRTTTLKRLVELLAAALEVEPRVLRQPMQPGDVLRTYADVAKAGRLLGYAPRTPVEEGIRRFAEWLKDRERERRVRSSRGKVELAR